MKDDDNILNSRGKV